KTDKPAEAKSLLNKSNSQNKIVKSISKANGNSERAQPLFQAPPGCESLFDEEGNLAPDLQALGLDPKLVESVSHEIMENQPKVTWDDICGLDFQKERIKECVVWPLLRPDIFTGLRNPPKGVLLFGPPGTGKTLIAKGTFSHLSIITDNSLHISLTQFFNNKKKAIANQAGRKFFAISASSLTSRWFGEAEKLVKTLFAVARHFEPAIIFIDEIGLAFYSLLSQRKEGDFEASRRLKTEFLVQMDGAQTQKESRILVIGATNRPQELDEAARRRLVRKLYVPLQKKRKCWMHIVHKYVYSPDRNGRLQMLRMLLKKSKHEISESEMETVVSLTDGYSAADIETLVIEAAMGPLRSVSNIAVLKKKKKMLSVKRYKSFSFFCSFEFFQTVSSDEVRSIIMEDFEKSLTNIKPSVSEKELVAYVEWNAKYGSSAL
ncbi:hypothetical protein RFI_10810, partial [Reticulomyxa filosa]